MSVAVSRRVIAALSAALLLAAGLVMADAGGAKAVDATFSISGKVSLPSDAPTTYYQAIYAYAWEVGGVNTGAAWLNPFDGTYTIPNLPSGDYKVSFTVSDYDDGGTAVHPNLVEELYNNAFTQDDAATVTIAGGDVTGINASLPWAGAISGKVTLASGLPAAWMKGVDIALVGDNGFSTRLNPNASSGAWSATGLPAGTYLVTFSPTGYPDGAGFTFPTFLDEIYNNAYTPSAATKVTVTERATKTGINASLDTIGHFTTTTTPVIKSLALNAGSTLSMSAATWVPAADFAVQWKRNGVAIPGATKTTYKLTAADRGKKITVMVRGTKATFATESKTSAALAIPTIFTKTPTPTISGTAKAGSTLTAKAGSWSPKPTLSYQWKRDGAAIAGETASAYKVRKADRGHDVSVTVTASKSGYLTTAKTSATVHAAKVFTKTVTPTITGTAKSGHTLSAHRGSWSPKPTKYTYQWYRGGSKISGATKATYKLVAKDKGKKITVKVTAKRGGYLTTTKTSAAKTVGR